MGQFYFGDPGQFYIGVNMWIAQQAAYDLWQARQAAKETNALAAIKTLKIQPA